MTYPITTTLKALRNERYFWYYYNKLVRALQGRPFTKKDKARRSYLDFDHEEPIPLTFILESNNLSDALRSLCASNASDQDICRLGLAFARRVEHLDETGAAKRCNDVNERFLNGQATIHELIEANNALLEARKAAREAREAAGEAGEAGAAALGAAAYAAWAATDETWVVVDAGDAAHAAAYAVDEAARESEREAQEELFIQMCNGKAPWQEGQS